MFFILTRLVYHVLLNEQKAGSIYEPSIKPKMKSFFISVIKLYLYITRNKQISLDKEVFIANWP
jgi:hypothetical protein